MVGNQQKIHELGTNRRTRNKRKDSERNQRENSKGSGGRMERRTGEQNSSGIYRRFKKELKEEDYSGSVESIVWLRTRINSLNLGETSW